jgi:hypothetical protein
MNVAYFTNGVGTHPEAPCFFSLMQTRCCGAYTSDFKSSYGKVSGPNAPREAGSFWGRFFGLESYISYEDVKPNDVVFLQRTIGVVQQIFNSGLFVNKNVKHMLRIDALNRIFPDASFLIVERNLEDIALSVMRSRHELMDDPLQWWSVKPPNYNELKQLPLPEQVALQLCALKAKLDADLSGLDSQKTIRLQHERFCNKPEMLISKTQHLLGGISAKNPPVQAFVPVKNSPRSREEYELIELIRNVSAS